MEEKIAELQSQLEQLRTKKQQTETRIAGLQENLEQLHSENQELKEDLQRRKAERHQELLNATTEARLRAGFVRDREAEAQRLKELDDGTLILLAENAEHVAEKLAKAQSTGARRPIN
jgi:chromosome segregation ATPase